MGKFSKVSNSATINLEREAKRNRAIRYFTHSYNNLLGLLNVDSYSTYLSTDLWFTKLQVWGVYMVHTNGWNIWCLSLWFLKVHFILHISLQRHRSIFKTEAACVLLYREVNILIALYFIVLLNCSATEKNVILQVGLLGHARQLIILRHAISSRMTRAFY